jgi:transcriptional regulator with XRE-family HTH domain
MVGDRIKLLRSEKNISQEALAKNITSNQKQISKWERGQIEPNIDMLKKLADYFGVSVDYLLERVDY